MRLSGHWGVLNCGLDRVNSGPKESRLCELCEWNRPECFAGGAMEYSDANVVVECA